MSDGIFRSAALAERDLLEILVTIGRDNPAAAIRFEDRVLDVCAKLAEHPYLGTARPELGEEARSFPIGNYILLYRVIPEGVEIVRIVWGGRRLTGLFQSI